MDQTIVQGEIERVDEVGLIRRHRGPIAEVVVLGAGFIVGVAVLSGAASLLFTLI